MQLLVHRDASSFTRCNHWWQAVYCGCVSRQPKHLDPAEMPPTIWGGCVCPHSIARPPIFMRWRPSYHTSATAAGPLKNALPAEALLRLHTLHCCPCITLTLHSVRQQYMRVRQQQLPVLCIADLYIAPASRRLSSQSWICKGVPLPCCMAWQVRAGPSSAASKAPLVLWHSAPLQTGRKGA